MNTENFGFKKLTIDNWLVPDELFANVVHGISPDGNIIEFMTDNKWTQDILDFDLLEAVPVEVRKLFAVARGSIAYGYFFYPLITLATEQLYRVVEAAVDHKCCEMGRHKPKETFAGKIEWLIKESVITDKERWDAIRILRNEASHPESQIIISPGEVVNVLKIITECINSLFVKVNIDGS
jgi:hypothetical protein